MKFKRCLILLTILSLFNINSLVYGEGEKPVLIIGKKWVKNCIYKNILLPGGIKYKASASWVDPTGFNKYSVIYLEEGPRVKFPWNNKKDLQKIYDYVNAGGIIIAVNYIPCQLVSSRKLLSVANIFGFSEISKFSKKSQPVVVNIDERFTGADHEFEYKWLVNALRIKGLKSATPLGWYVDRNGEKISPCLTMNQIGEGKVFWSGIPFFRTFRAWGSLGCANDEGVFILNSKGKESIQLVALFDKMFKAGKISVHPQKKEKWVLKPLGEPGKLKYNLFKCDKKEQNRKINERSVAKKFFLSQNNTASAQIVYYDKFSLRCAEILKNHLDAITGGDFMLVADGKASSQKQSILVGTQAFKLTGINRKLSPEAAVIKVVGNKLIISGSDTSGVLFALYTLLEKFGCRFLWPGKYGKVIPRKTNLAIDDNTNIISSPQLKQRRIRFCNKLRPRYLTVLKRWQLPAGGFTSYFKKITKETSGREGWAAWHKLGSSTEIKYGHSFNNYWKRFGKKHLKWFALQANGLRIQNPSRPRFCMSNKQLIQQIALDRVRALKKSNADGVAIGLNDGGRNSFCMCEDCRRLDPVNAPKVEMQYFFKGRQKSEYVSLTDRVLSFSNKIMEKINFSMPGKYGGLYVYSIFSKPPVKVRPNPNLKLIIVPGNCINNEQQKQLQHEWMQWGSFKNDMFWRPNILHSQRKHLAPMNFAKKMCDDLKFRYNNSMKGVDFDSIMHHWALHGFIYYVLAKSLWNPQDTSYEDILDDYCRSGFGPGWKCIREYFTEIERITHKTSENSLPLTKLYTSAKVQSLQKLLNQAAKATSNQEQKGRIEFLKRGLELAALNHIRLNTPKNKRQQINKKIQAYFEREIKKDNIAVNPMAFY